MLQKIQIFSYFFIQVEQIVQGVQDVHVFSYIILFFLYYLRSYMHIQNSIKDLICS